MSLDLDPLLDGFDYTPGEVTARKVSGRDGREKIQMRTELGLIQLEADGPPDGHERLGYPSLLHFHRARMSEWQPGTGASASLRLSAEECRELFDEATVYYLRYICCLQLKEYRRAERDTTRNLEVMDLCMEHAANEDDRYALEQYRPFVLMMRARARAGRLMSEGDPAGAADSIADAIAAVRQLMSDQDQADLYDDAAEDIHALEALAAELKDYGGGVVDRVQLQLELRRAIDREDYRRAAELRDALNEYE
ncbi:MAG: hypothetical protein GF320_11905 [Armatimonadia bacterium]|nr:hypothetical protein [Armatimonadia bacterium]